MHSPAEARHERLLNGDADTHTHKDTGDLPWPNTAARDCHWPTDADIIRWRAEEPIVSDFWDD